MSVQHADINLIVHVLMPMDTFDGVRLMSVFLISCVSDWSRNLFEDHGSKCITT